MDRDNGINFIQPGEVHIWFAQPERLKDRSLISRYEGLLKEDELDSYRRLQRSEYRQEYLVSHVLLRTTLSCYINKPPEFWRFTANSAGKPELLDFPAVKFNLAHSNDMAVCAITLENDIGVDVELEANSESLLSVADQYFSDQELQALESVPKEDQGAHFFRYWTLKEAYIKARGLGQTVSTTDFSFQVSENTISFTPPVEDSADDWSFEILELAEGYSTAVALHGSLKKLSIYEGLTDDQKVVNFR